MAGAEWMYMAMLRQLGLAAQNLDYSVLMFERTELTG